MNYVAEGDYHDSEKNKCTIPFLGITPHRAHFIRFLSTLNDKKIFLNARLRCG